MALEEEPEPPIPRSDVQVSLSCRISLKSPIHNLEVEVLANIQGKKCQKWRRDAAISGLKIAERLHDILGESEYTTAFMIFFDIKCGSISTRSHHEKHN
ncbi:hypothetical protein PanWU01x14_313250 [Parasponia andersonii]|uniref:Uncharacterized protein n=1 Tax=Parasponia andersonii TaxID=3476 RepID=A0A2P5AP63_PARAD|nr:hypothetical protein PanWU01x14_313250 [Parasponia andersonii]